MSLTAPVNFPDAAELENITFLLIDILEAREQQAIFDEPDYLDYQRGKERDALKRLTLIGESLYREIGELEMWIAADTAIGTLKGKQQMLEICREVWGGIGNGESDAR